MKAVLIMSIILFDPAVETKVIEFPSMTQCVETARSMAVGYGMSNERSLKITKGFTQDIRGPGWPLRGAVGQISVVCNELK